MNAHNWKPYLVTGAAVLSLALASCSVAIAQPASKTDTVRPREVTLQATEMRFQPATLSLTAGQPVRLVLRNDGALLHDVALVGLHADVHEAAGHEADHEADHEAEHEADHGMGHAMSHEAVEMGNIMVHVDAPAHSSAMVEFTPTETGTYQFICTVPGHREAGMTGRVVVK